MHVRSPALSMLASSHLYCDWVCFVTGTGVTLLATMQCVLCSAGVGVQRHQQIVAAAQCNLTLAAGGDGSGGASGDVLV